MWRAPYVDMLINFLYQDDVADSPTSSGWQSGFVTARGAAKPSLRAFMLPLVRVARTGEQTTVWGQVRPRDGRSAVPSPGAPQGCVGVQAQPADGEQRLFKIRCTRPNARPVWSRGLDDGYTLRVR